MKTTLLLSIYFISLNKKSLLRGNPAPESTKCLCPSKLHNPYAKYQDQTIDTDIYTRELTIKRYIITDYTFVWAVC